MPFNKNQPTKSRTTVNLAGGPAVTLDDATALYISVSTNLGAGTSDSYYTSAQDQSSGIVNLVNSVAKKDPAMIFQLAAYARKEMNLRSIPTVLFIEGIRAMHANKKAGEAYPVDVTQFAKFVFARPDEINEALAYWLQVSGGKKLPMPLRESLGIALNSFDEYQFVKYDQDKAVKFRDVLRLVHPHAKDATQNAIYNYLIRGVDDKPTSKEGARRPLTTAELKELLPKTAAREALLKLKEFDAQAQDLIKASGATWENVISKFGSKKEVWEAVVPNMGYMALLRNLNNFVKSGLDLKPILTKLADGFQVRKSKQLPFRFFSALRAFASTDPFTTQEVNKALSTALEESVANVPKLPGRTFVSADLSGSMSSVINARTMVTARDIACVMAGLAVHVSDNGIASAFGESFAVLSHKGNTLLSTINQIGALNVGHSTNAWKCVDYLLSNKIVVDRVILCTDTQCYDSGSGYSWGYGSQSLKATWEKYRAFLKTQGKDATMYELNLVGGNTSNFHPSANVLQLGGWSEKIFDIISSHEEDPRQAIKKIKEMYPVNASRELTTA